ncbi:MAG: hypothetical protein MMC33_002928 [Icmadophila ericetorum]|nr:hypothetical protein [Icmadophila ericetorum]
MPFFGNLLHKKSNKQKKNSQASTNSSLNSPTESTLSPFVMPPSQKIAAPAPAPAPTPSYSYQPTRRPNTEAPPSYVAAVNSGSPIGPATNPFTAGTPQNDGEDPFEFLTEFDTIFLIDDSGSMAGSNWTETSRALCSIAPVCTSRDADGIDVYFINNKQVYKGIKSEDQVLQTFGRVRPGGGTRTGQRLEDILLPYLRQCSQKGCHSVKPLNIIVITDGCPTDDLHGVIIQAAKKLDTLDAPLRQVGIQFFQVGNDPEATKALQVLDDDLSQEEKGLRDIVDTVPWMKEGLSANSIMKVVMGAVNRRLDAQSNGPTIGRSSRR